MNFSEYQQKALTLAVFPDLGHRVIYPVLGLLGEAGEVVEKVKKLYRDDGGEITEERKAQFVKELGDVLWYTSVIVSSLSEDIRKSHFELGLLDSYQLDVTQSEGDFGMIVWGLRLARYASGVGTVAEQNMILTGNYSFGKDVQDLLVFWLIHTLRALAMLSAKVGAQLGTDVAVGNLAKLFSRKDRGKLHGDGDDR
jgi:hypothetical protein